MSQRTVVHVVPIFDGWAVKFDGSKSAFSTHVSKSEAEKSAVSLAQSMTPSEVVLHKEDGTVDAGQTYDDDVDL
jgi:hypothetical protein